MRFKTIAYAIPTLPLARFTGLIGVEKQIFHTFTPQQQFPQKKSALIEPRWIELVLRSL